MVDVSTSKTGKHGHAKCNFTAIDIFNGKKLEDMCPSTHNVDVRFSLARVCALLPSGVQPTWGMQQIPCLVTGVLEVIKTYSTRTFYKETQTRAGGPMVASPGHMFLR